MAENKNMALNDEAMRQATGGISDSNPHFIFNIGDWVIMTSRPKNGKGQVKSIELMEGGDANCAEDWMYTVYFPEWYGGQEYTAPYTIFERA